VPENNDMRNQDFGQNRSLAVFEAVFGQMSSDLNSITKELKEFTTQLRRYQRNFGQQVTPNQNFQDVQRRSQRYFDDFESNIERTSKSLDDLKKYIKQLSSETSRAIDDIKFQQRNLTGITRNVESLSMDRQISILEQYQKRLSEIEAETSRRESEREAYSQSIKDITKDIEDARKQLSDEEKKRIAAIRVWQSEINKDRAQQDPGAIRAAREEVDKYSESVKNLREEIIRQQNHIRILNEQTEESRRIQEQTTKSMKDAADKERKEESENLEQRLGPVLRLVEESSNAFNSAAGQSSILSDWIKDNEATEADRFNAMIKRTSDSLDRAINALTEKIEEDARRLSTETDLTQDQRDNITAEMENLSRERENIRRQREAISKVTPVAETMKKTADDIKEVPWKSVKGIISNLTRTIEAKYLDSYLEAFDKVYNSVENTRNTVSARLKLDQGGFEDLQNEIFEQIEEQNLTGAISLADVNEALVSLSSAGIADEDILKQFALEQTKLQATGSALNLTNEEMLTRLMSQIKESVASGMSKDEAIQVTLSQLETVAQTESAYRKQTGNDMAFVNAGLDQIVNSVLDLDTAFGKSQEDIAKDLQDAVVTAGSLQSYGVDPNILLSQLRELAEGRLTDTSAIAQILRQAGLTKEDLQTVGMGDALKTISDNLYDILGDISLNNPEYLADVASVLGVSGTQEDLQRLMRAIESGGIQTTLSEETIQYIGQISETDEKALSEGTYLSATESWNKKQESRATEEAITMEEIYKGNEIFHATVGGILDGVKEIISILENGTFSIGDAFRTSGMAIFGGAGASSSSTGGTSGTTPPTGASGGIPPVGAGFATTARNFMTGDLSTTAGKVGTGLGVGLGAGMSIYSFATADGEDLGEKIVNTFEDPTFAQGLGVAAGSALAGPIGGAIGGALGRFLKTTISPALDKFTDFTSGYAEQFEESNKYQLEASENLNLAAESIAQTTDNLNNDINSRTGQIEQQKQVFESFNTNQKIRFIEQQQNEKVDSENTAEVNEKFNKAVEKWVEAQEKAIEQDKAKISAISGSEDIISKIMTDNSSEFISGDALQNVDNLIRAGLIDEEDVKKNLIKTDVGYTESGRVSSDFMSGLSNAFEEYKKASDTRYDSLAIQSEQGAELLKNIESYKEATKPEVGPEISTASAIQQVYKDQIDSGMLDEAGVEQLASQLDELRKNKDLYESSNTEFRKKWSRIKQLHPDVSNLELLEEYDKAYNTSSVADAISGIQYDPTGLSVTIPLDEDGYPSLKKSSPQGRLLYDPKFYFGKFETGLTDVPFDDYPALLHEGERVLTKEESDSYNELSSSAIAQLGNLANIDINGILDSYNDLSSDAIKQLENLATTDIHGVLDSYNELSSNITKQLGNMSTIDISEVLESYNEIASNAVKQLGNLVTTDIKEILDSYNNLSSDDVTQLENPATNDISEVLDDFTTKIIDKMSVINELSADNTINNIGDYLSDQYTSTSSTGFSTYINSDESLNEKFYSLESSNSDVASSINTQTSTLEKKLDIIIEAMNTLISAMRLKPRQTVDNSNVLRMNSNATQISTSGII
jgi:ABC-type transporter Mla subunit MlaD